MLAERGWGSLALDARGHGESGGPRYTTFRSPEDWARIVAAWPKLSESIRAAVVAVVDAAGKP